MNSLVRCTYLVTMFLGQMVMLAFAIAVPVYITPGQYWWTAFLLFCVLGDGYMIGKRMNLWEGDPK